MTSVKKEKKNQNQASFNTKEGAVTGEQTEEMREEILEAAPVVLTGGHGGAVPAFIMWVVKKIFRSRE